MFRTVELLSRDEFGVHDGEARPVRAFLRRAYSAIVAPLVRPRRFSPEIAFWAVIVVLLALFVVVLITGESGVARGGR